MRLDMYAYATSQPITDEVDFKPDWERATIIHQWRRHPNLHGWMEQLYRAKDGKADEFNLVALVLPRRISTNSRPMSMPASCRKRPASSSVHQTVLSRRTTSPSSTTPARRSPAARPFSTIPGGRLRMRGAAAAARLTSSSGPAPTPTRSGRSRSANAPSPSDFCRAGVGFSCSANGQAVLVAVAAAVIASVAWCSPDVG